MHPLLFVALLSPTQAAAPPVSAALKGAPAPTAAAPATAPSTATTDAASSTDASTDAPRDASGDASADAAGDASTDASGDAAGDAAAPGAKAGPGKLVAVLDLKVEGDAKALANALSTVMASEISGRPGYRAVSRNELKSLLAHSADARLLGCDSANCATDVAKLVDADLVVAGTLGQVVGGEAGPGGKALLLTLSLIDPSGPAVVQRVDVTWRGDPEEMVTVTAPTLDRLFDGPKAATYTGAVEVFAPEGATVAVDGKDVGTAPLKQKIDGLAIGVHVLDVTQAGAVPGRKDVVVSRGETSVARVVLEEEPYYTQWWFWTAVGGGAAVAVAAGTTIAIATLQQPVPATRILVKTPLPSTTGAE